MVPLFIQRAACHKFNLMWTEAYFDYSFAIRMEPDNGTLYCLRGICLAKLKKVAMAIEDLDLSCKVLPYLLYIIYDVFMLGVYCSWKLPRPTSIPERQSILTLEITSWL